MGLNTKKYGDVFLEIINDKNISKNLLTQKLNLSSRNIITRIIKDTCKYSTILDFHENLIDNKNRLPFNDVDLSNLEEALIVNKIGKDKYIASSILLSLFDENINYVYEDNSNCEISYGEDSFTKHNITYILSNLKEYKKCEIHISNCVNENLIIAINELIKEQNITIHHYISLADDADINLNILTKLLILDINDFYTPYIIDNDNTIKISNDNSIVVLKEDINDVFHIDKINFITDDKFIGLFNICNVDNYLYYESYYSILKNNYKHMKKSLEDFDDLDRIINISQKMKDCEDSWQTILIKPDFGINHIPLDILQNLLKDINYYNLSEDSEKIVLLYDIYKYRNKIINLKNRNEIFIFTREGVENLLNTGKFSNHPKNMRAFNEDEMKKILYNIISLYENNKGFELYMFYDNIKPLKFMCKICSEKALVLADPYTNYDENYYDFTLQDKDIINFCIDFVRNVLIPKYTYSSKDTIEFLTELYEKM